MTKAEILKKEILRQYRSVRQFAMEMNIPYSTLVTALERGIEGMAYGTVIKMCDKLSHASHPTTKAREPKRPTLTGKNSPGWWAGCGCVV